MEYIHFEKQEGSLCAQHCLNSLLQGAYFTPVDLAQHAYELDEAERQTMAEGDVNSDDYVMFMNKETGVPAESPGKSQTCGQTRNTPSHSTKQPSSNMDDSGFFSIQVICRALEVWNLTATPYSSPKLESTRQNPAGEKSFICNLQEHWFTIRKLGRQWFNLNSVASGPELISETYLSLFLTQLQNEGYSIFVVRGVFPDCESDQMLTLLPVDPTKVKSTSTRGKSKNVTKNNDTKTAEPKQVDVDEVRKKREQFYSTRFNNDSGTSPPQTSQTISSPPPEETEEEMLQRALALSLTQG